MIVHRALAPAITKFRTFIAVAIVAIALPGCDPIYGISARKITVQPPDEACISSALRQTPGITDVQVRTITNESWLLVGDGPRHGTPIRYFTYNVGRTYAPTLH